MNIDALANSRNAERDFHAERRTNQTRASTTDPDARLYRKGRDKEARLCHMGYLLTENRNGLTIDALVTPATGTGGSKPLPLLVCGRAAGEVMEPLPAPRGQLGEGADPRPYQNPPSSIPALPA